MTEEQRHFESLTGEEKVKLMGNVLKEFNDNKQPTMFHVDDTMFTRKKVNPIPKGML